MEAYGPLTRRGNALVPDSRTSSDWPESAHNVSAKPAVATTHSSNAVPATHSGRAATSAAAAATFAPAADGTALIRAATTDGANAVPATHGANAVPATHSGSAVATTHGGRAVGTTHADDAATFASTGTASFAPTADGTALIGRDTPRVIELLLAGRGSMLKDIVSLIGIDPAARLIAAFGGMRLYVPHAPEPNDTLSELIGFDPACALARIYGGDRIDVPNPTPRGIQILELRASGVSIDGIARALHCTRRRVFQVLAEARRKQRLREVHQIR